MKRLLGRAIISLFTIGMVVLLAEFSGGQDKTLSVRHLWPAAAQEPGTADFGGGHAALASASDPDAPQRAEGRTCTPAVHCQAGVRYLPGLEH